MQDLSMPPFTTPSTVLPVSVSQDADPLEVWERIVAPKYLRHRQLMVAATTAHGLAAMEYAPPARGERVLDVGTGTGESALLLAARVGPRGRVLGVDGSASFLELARQDLTQSGYSNVAFAELDAGRHAFGPSFDLCFSQFGTMFFEQPGAAFRNLRGALHPGGRLLMSVWRSLSHNDWLGLAKGVAERTLGAVPEDAPSCGPGPFSLASPDTVHALLGAAGFGNIELQEVRCDVNIGDSVEQATDFALDLGPAGEIVRFFDDADGRARVRAGLAELFAQHLGPEGIQLGSASWIVSATHS
ncbi:MAG: class I SAM-dependent methyltransferase [Myxococcales bacterium]|nr:class I SAM-dependent methyltransferase [Myxococcales bacterium]